MKTTRELLELAARAMNCTLTFESIDGTGGLVPYLWGEEPGDEIGEWDPSEDDGDSARLESALGLDVVWNHLSVFITDHAQGNVWFEERYSDHNGDKQAARRLATLRAASMIGGKLE